MANIFTRIFRRNAPSTLPSPSNSNGTLWGNYQWFSSPFVGSYSDIYFYSLINKIFNGLDNSNFVNLGTSSTVDFVASFINSNIKHLVWNMWRDGYVIVDITDPSEYVIVEGNIIQRDNNGAVIIPPEREWVVYYSDLYTLKRKSTFQIIENELCFMNRLGSSLDYLTSTYGAVGIITGKTMPMNVADKEDLNEQLKQNLGITRNKQQFIISRGNDLDIKQFSFDMGGLDLDGKLRDQYLLLADFFNVPKNILTTDTDSTYENQNAALRRFYTDCISPLCEKMLSIGREIIIRSYEIVPSTDLTFRFDNVEVIKTDEVFLATLEKLTAIINATEDESAKRQLTDILLNKIENYEK